MGKLVKVYQVNCEADFFQFFVVASEKLDEKLMFDKKRPLDFDGRSKLKSWKPPEVKIYKPKLKKGDFYAFCPGSFVASPAAWEKAAMYLEMAGEVLSLPYKDEEFGLLNITEVIECLDDRKSEWAETVSGRRLRKPYFDPSSFGESSIFKIPYGSSRIYCYEASRDPESEFKAFVEKEKLTGLSFREVWSDKK